jgi:hypothetical protein
VSAWRVTVACCALLAAASCTASEDNADPSPSPSDAPSSAAAGTPGPQDPVLSPGPGEVLELDPRGPEYVFTRQGRYAVRLNPHLLYEVDAPDMWEVYRGRYFSTSDFSGGAGVFSVAGPVTHASLPAHPCRNRDLVPVGTTARDLADALGAQPVLQVTRPKPVSLTAGRGVYVEVKIPEDVPSASCQGGDVALFSWRGSPPEWWVVTAGNTLHFWILDVDGQRLVLAGFCETPCEDAELESLGDMADSVTFVKES